MSASVAAIEEVAVLGESGSDDYPEYRASRFEAIGRAALYAPPSKSSNSVFSVNGNLLVTGVLLYLIYLRDNCGNPFSITTLREMLLPDRLDALVDDTRVPESFKSVAKLALGFVGYSSTSLRRSPITNLLGSHSEDFLRQLKFCLIDIFKNCKDLDEKSHLTAQQYHEAFIKHKQASTPVPISIPLRGGRLLVTINGVPDDLNLREALKIMSAIAANLVPKDEEE